MTDPWQDQADAAFRELDRKRDELEAAREANGRLTADLVRSQLGEYNLRRQLASAESRIAALEQLVEMYADAQQRLTEALIDAHRLSDRLEERLTARGGADA